MSDQAPSLCVVVPALNEEEAINDTVHTILTKGEKYGLDIQICLINDGSTDKTGALMDQLAQEHPCISVRHNAQPSGLASSFHHGIDHANGSYLTIIPGDNAFSADGIDAFFKSIGTTDMVVTFREGQKETRTFIRYFLSMTYTKMMSFLFGGGLKDYHSMVAYPVKLLRTLNLKAEGPPYQIEAIVKLLRHKPSIAQVPVSLNARLETRSSALRFKTVQQLAITILQLLLRR